MPSNLLRNLPSVNELLESPPLKGLVSRVSHNVVVSRVRSFLDDLRTEIQATAAEVKFPDVKELAQRIAERILEADKPQLRPVINATGVLLHTGLGRAPLAEEAIAEMVAVARDYASVELDLATGQRSQRVLAVEGLLTELTGAEAALVVNNNAGATMLALAALAAGREVIVSRGQLIEIGGSYRLPEVMATSGAVLREVGTTNKTRLDDYDRAIGEATAALMLVHPSNFVVAGFSESVPLAELAKLGRSKSLPVIHDIGSGAMIDFAEFGFADEPVAATSIKQGADLVLFSGDKLLGGPQCGVIVGRRELIDKISRHPLTRALRVDKLTLAALAGTLRLYRDLGKAKQRLPLLQLLSTSLDNLRTRAERLAPQTATSHAIAAADAIADVTYLGGGAVPTQQLNTWCVALTPAEISVDRLAARLRTGQPSVIGRVRDERLYLDLRTVFPRQDLDLVSAVRAVGENLPAP
ncbi:MAG: L-seryl-tRNA(Sec) selenium transferase [Planctomycetia bacterium 21-64-5]|nr:MAG: L-seryl-tRNA(Sec) selenium transferase [Planctomycetia bacterium 21-64-5]HQU42894.1 L-seryl-tRNA(Sec) selenium transferase [Pirellulales bacterium]